MKSYIRGVGSGLPIVKEYLEFTHGTITIEDNLGSGSVVTISANGSRPELPEELKLESEAPEVTPAPRYRIASGDEAPEPIAAPRYNVAPEPTRQQTKYRSLHTRSKRPCSAGLSGSRRRSTAAALPHSTRLRTATTLWRGGARLRQRIPASSPLSLCAKRAASAARNVQRRP